MALRTRGDVFRGLHTGLKVREIVKTSRLVSRMCSFPVPRNKAIVGANAFAHGSGIHQDGILKKRETYEIMNPREVGWGVTELPLTKHSGRAAVAARLRHLGFKMTDADLAVIFTRFKELGDRKKFVYDDDLAALVEGHITEVRPTWSLEYLSVSSGNQTVPTATVRLRKFAGSRGAARRQHRRRPGGRGAQSDGPHHPHAGKAPGLPTPGGVRGQGCPRGGDRESGLCPRRRCQRQRRQHRRHRGQRPGLLERGKPFPGQPPTAAGPGPATLRLTADDRSLITDGR